MKYCGNCGKETTKKICPHCGVKAGKEHNYCGWCGNEVDKNAVECPNCYEKLNEGTIKKIGKILGAFVAIFLLFMAFGYASDGDIATTILFGVSGLLLLPFVGSIIKKLTFKKKTQRKIFSIIRVLVIVGFVIGGFNMIDMTGTDVYPAEATEAALEVFHDEVSLKNEDSFVLNDSSVTYETPYEGDENLAYVKVILDYSAQNGFGGMNRDTYTVELIFNYSDGSYRPA